MEAVPCLSMSIIMISNGNRNVKGSLTKISSFSHRFVRVLCWWISYLSWSLEYYHLLLLRSAFCYTSDITTIPIHDTLILIGLYAENPRNRVSRRTWIKLTQKSKCILIKMAWFLKSLKKIKIWAMTSSCYALWIFY